ncbi:MAG: DUF2793 domain-containing protein [Crenarchaeota archaeon]|nr:DUF2793 domain-containing protein [Thermoproteota archaeon]
MADRKPLVLLDNGILGQIPDTDVLYCKTYATEIVGLDSVTKEIIGLNCVQDSATIHWTFDNDTQQLSAHVIDGSITNAHIADDAAIAWSKIDKTGSSLADIPTRRHNDLQSIQGGSVDSYYHLTQSEHDTLTEGNDATDLHNHNTIYYTKAQLGTSGQAIVDWDNIINTPATYPPSPHTHTASDITDLTSAVHNIVGSFVADSNSVKWDYDTDGQLLYANVAVTDSDTIALSINTDGIVASLVSGSITNDHIADAANIAWSKIDKTGSKLSDISDVVINGIVAGNGLIYNGTDFVPAQLTTNEEFENHRTAPVIDHPDQSVTLSKLALNIDASGIGFIADKVDGADLNDSGTSQTDLWSASKIISYVHDQVSTKITWLDPVIDILCTPPASPNDGDRYIICGTDPTGDWANYENAIATYDSTTESWQLDNPLPDDVVYVENQDKIYGFDGSEWKVRFSAINDHEQLKDLLGGAPNEHYHVTSNEHNLLVKGLDASSLHNHNTIYYTKTDLVTVGAASVDWNNIINTPTEYPPAPHTHTASDITDFDSATKNVIDNYIVDSDTIQWTDLTDGTRTASIVPNSIDWSSLAFEKVTWNHIDTTGSKLDDIDDVAAPTNNNQILVRTNNEWVPTNVKAPVEFVPYQVLSAGPKLIASTTYPIPILLNGFDYKGTPTDKEQNNINQIFNITSPLTLTTIDQGRLLDSSWYSMFMVLDPTTNSLVGCLSLMFRVNTVTFNTTSGTSTIVLAKQSDPTSILTTTTIGWDVDNYSSVNGTMLALTGSLEGQTFTILSNTTQGQAAIEVEGDLSSLQQGDWIQLSPQLYDKYRYIGEAFCEQANPVQWRTGYKLNRNLFVYDQAYPFFAGSADSITAIDLSSIIPPTAVALEMCEYTASNLNTTFYLDSGGTKICKQLNMSGYFIFYMRQSCDRIPINMNEHSLYIETTYATFYTRGYCYGN